MTGIDPTYGAVITLKIANKAIGFTEFCFLEYDQGYPESFNEWQICNRMSLDQKAEWYPVQTYLRFSNESQSLFVNQTWLCDDNGAKRKYVYKVHHPGDLTNQLRLRVEGVGEVTLVLNSGCHFRDEAVLTAPYVVFKEVYTLCDYKDATISAT
jgi:hypothetical protein